MTNAGFFADKTEERKKTARAQRNTRAAILFLASVAYGLFALFIVSLALQGHAHAFLLALYVYGFIGGLGFLLVNQFYADVSRGHQLLTEVLEKSAEARAITGPDGEVIYTNKRFALLVGDEENPTLAGFARIFANPQEVERRLDDLRLKAAPAGSAFTELQPPAQGRNLWLRVTCQHIIGWPGYVHWQFDDITPYYQMEAAIRAEREKLRDFTDNAPVGLFSVDEEGRFLFANDMLLRMLATDHAALMEKRRLHDFLAAPPAGGRPCDCFADGGPSQHGELMMKAADGRVFRAAVTHSLAEEEGKTISRSIVYDLTAEQKMRQALSESEDRFQRLFEEAPVGICMLDAEMVVRDANQVLAGMLHLPVGEIVGKPLVSHVSRESLPRVEEWLQRLSSDRAAPFIEASLKGLHGVVTQLYARKFVGGSNFVIHFIDLTEQKNLERQFTQSQKMQAIGQLAGGIAHDFNNLLTAIIGFADLLLLRHKPGDHSFADIMQIKQNANRAANLVRQLLAFSRQQTLQPRILDLTDVLTELSHLLRRLIGTNIDLRISHGSELGLIKTDQGQMEQVIINLVVNARDAMPQGGKLTVRTENFANRSSLKLGSEESLPPGEWVAVTVEDTGTGIDPAILPHIFEPFFTTKEVGAGTGLGLATVHGIVHQTGGYIAVNSTVGQGTAFTIYLPRHKEAATGHKAEAAEEKTAVADLTGSARLLLVEDEDAVRIFSARALSNKGYQVADAPGAALALQLMEEKKFIPDVLITDVMMPEMDGTALARIVHEKYPQVQIIFMSGYAEDRFKEQLGANAHFLPKPFTLKQLATKVKEVIDSRGEE